MNKRLQLITSIALLAASTSLAINPTFRSLLNQKQETPDYVQNFLKTNVGKNYTSEDVLKAFNNAQPASEVPSSVKATVVLSEDFSKWTKGSEAEPDTLDISDELDSYTSMTGWQGLMAYQAGGMAYLGYDEVGNEGPGYLLTPGLDLSEGDGVYRVKFTAKNVNPLAQDQALQYFVLDQRSSNMILANTLPITCTDWSDVEFTSKTISDSISIMMLGWQGKILVKNVTIEKLTYPLSSPKNIAISVVGGGKVNVTWDEVENATSYEVTVSDKTNSITATSNTNSIELEGELTPDEALYAKITAKNGEEVSYPSTGKLESFEYTGTIEAPVAKEATEISDNGFTANWDLTEFANDYVLTLNRKHTATEDGEEYCYMDEDFDEIPYTTDDPESTVQNQGNAASFDNYINTKGWNTFLGVAFQGALGFTNMYEPYGFPGALFSNAADYSIGNGNVTIEAVGMSFADDVVIKVGFGKITKKAFGGMAVTFDEGAQEFEVSTTGSLVNVNLTGGKSNSQLIFQITDAAEGGDIVVFDNLKIYTTLLKGETVSGVYKNVTLPYNVNSYKVEVPFPETDEFSYSVVGTFGSNSSEASNVITVLPNPSAIEYNQIGKDFTVNATATGLYINNPKQYAVSIYTVDGKLVNSFNEGQSDINVNVPNGIYVVRVGEKSLLVAKRK